MIVRSKWRQAGGLEAHLLRTDTNERVEIRTDLFRGADDLHSVLRLMEAIARTNPRAKRAFIHTKVSPAHPLTETELVQCLSMIEAEQGIAPDAARAVVVHLKGNRAAHAHAIYPVVDVETGRAIKSHGNYGRDELISRRLELLFGERIVPGPRIEANIAELRRRGLFGEAEKLAPHARVRHEDALARADRQQAARLGVAPIPWSAKVFALFEASGRDLALFSNRLAASGVSVARDKDRATLVLDDPTGFTTSLVRLLRREAKAAGQPLTIAEKEVAAAFPTAGSFEKARDAGFERACTVAERDLAAERRKAFLEAAADRDAAEIETFRLKARKIREEAEAAGLQTTQNETLKARREAIMARYRERDRIRKGRVDRAFRGAQLLDTPERRRLVFALAGAGLLLSGGSIGLAFVGASVALGALPTRARARRMAAAARRERADDAAQRSGEIAQVYREGRQRDNGVRFSFDHVAREDRVLAGFYADALLRGATSDAAPRRVADALGPQIVTGLSRMLERGSPLQARRLLHWHRAIAPNRRHQAVEAALKRHATAGPGAAAAHEEHLRTRSNRSGRGSDRRGGHER